MILHNRAAARRKGANPLAVLKPVRIETKTSKVGGSRKGANPLAVLKPQFQSTLDIDTLKPQRGQPFSGIETPRVLTLEPLGIVRRKGANPLAVLKHTISIPNITSTAKPQRGQPFSGIET